VRCVSAGLAVAPLVYVLFVTLYVIPAVKTTSAAAAIAGRAHVRRTTMVDRFRSKGSTGASMRSAMPAHRSREGASVGSAAASSRIVPMSSSSCRQSAHPAACDSMAARTASGASPSR
jgi:hypothetical protein